MVIGYFNFNLHVPVDSKTYAVRNVFNLRAIVPEWALAKNMPPPTGLWKRSAYSQKNGTVHIQVPIAITSNKVPI